MYTKETLKSDLLKMGLKTTDSIMIHSSMKSIGEVSGGADTVVEALMEYFEEGLLMMPTHTWKQMSKEYNIFNPKKEDGCVGIIPNIFWKRKNVYRSFHPTHSIAAYGKMAAEYIRNDDYSTTPCAPDGCFGKLKDINGKILLIGVNHIKNTFIHSVEEMYDVPERFTECPVEFKVITNDGSYRNVKMYRHFNKNTAHISESYDKLTEALYDTGAATLVKFGDAECILCDAKKVCEVVGRILTKEVNCLIDRESIPKEWWSE